MTNETLVPSGLSDSRQRGYGQVVVSSGGWTVYCSGLTARSKCMSQKDLGVLRQWGLDRQFSAALQNVALALEAAGATVADLVRLNVYVVNYKPVLHAPIIVEGLKRFCDPDHLPSSTLLGVQSLAAPEYLVEVEATAVVDAQPALLRQGHAGTSPLSPERSR